MNSPIACLGGCFRPLKEKIEPSCYIVLHSVLMRDFTLISLEAFDVQPTLLVEDYVHRWALSTLKVVTY